MYGGKGMDVDKNYTNIFTAKHYATRKRITLVQPKIPNVQRLE
jgi:hypothetical protein